MPSFPLTLEDLRALAVMADEYGDRELDCHVYSKPSDDGALMVWAISKDDEDEHGLDSDIKFRLTYFGECNGKQFVSLTDSNGVSIACEAVGAAVFALLYC